MRTRILAATTLILFAAQSHATNGYFSLGYGIASKAEGGTGIALARDALTIATNPAGLADIGQSLELGVDVFEPSRGATITQGGFPADFDGNGTSTFFIPEAGYSHALGSKVTIGVALFGNGGMNTDYHDNPFARFGAKGSAGVDLSQAFVSPAVAIKLGDSQSLGIALNFVYQRFKAKGIGAFAPFSSDPAHLSDQGYDSSTGVGARIGWQGRFGDRVRVGATWQPRTHTSEFDSYRGLFADHGGFDIPETYGIGIAVKPNDAWQLALDWQEILYSGVPSVGNPINTLFSGVPLGASNGPGFGWRDISVLKLGTDVRVNDRFVLRAGLSSADQPIPSSQTFFNILAPGVVRTHATFGVTWKVAKEHELDFGYVHAFKETVHGSGSIPPAFGGGEVDVHLEEDSIGFAWRHNFGSSGAR